MASQDSQALIKILEEIADFLELQGENVFKVKAYQKAARALESSDKPLAELYSQGELAQWPGFGKALLEKVGQFLQTGQLELHQQLKSQFPGEILRLMDVPGLGAKKASVLYRELQTGSLEDLKRALDLQQIRQLKGFGIKTEEKLREGLALLEQGQQRWLLSQGHQLAQSLLGALRQVPGVTRAEFAGSLRRGKETLGDLDLLVACESPPVVMETFCGLAQPSEDSRVLLQGPTKSSLLWQGRFQVDLRCLPESSFGAALQYFTGSKDHNVALRGRAEQRGFRLNEYALLDGSGQAVAGADEAEIYQALGLPWIPPELRESGLELEWAQEGRLPELVEAQQILGNLHTHSTWSDGRNSLEQLAQEAIRRGYRYLAITDHSRSLVVANGLTLERLLQQGQEIARLNQSWGSDFRLLWGSECDILSDGSLDYPDEILAQLDFVVVAVHSHFQMPSEAMTERLCRALANPYVDVLAHPSGRILGKRAGYQADWEAVYRQASQYGVALEINGSAERLDLSDRAARRAAELGCNLSLGSDAHSLEEFDNLAWALLQARRAGLSPQRLLNTRSLPTRAKPKPTAC